MTFTYVLGSAANVPPQELAVSWTAPDVYAAAIAVRTGESLPPWLRTPTAYPPGTRSARFQIMVNPAGVNAGTRSFTLLAGVGRADGTIIGTGRWS